MKFKVFLLTVFASIFLLSTAQAVPVNFSLDLSSFGYGTTDTMSKIQFTQDAEINQNTSGGTGVVQPGDTFTEDGVAYTSGYVFTNSGANDNGGLGTDYEMTWGFDLSGEATDFVTLSNGQEIVFFDFYAGGTTQIYVQPQGTASPQIDGNNPEPTSTYSNYTTGSLMADFIVKEGNGNLNIDTGNGNVNLKLQFLDTASTYGIWYDEDGNDMVQDFAALNLSFGLVDSTQTVAQTIVNPDSLNINVIGSAGLTADVVPEPTTLLLFGTGLLGLGVLGRRKLLKT